MLSLQEKYPIGTVVEYIDPDSYNDIQSGDTGEVTGYFHDGLYVQFFKNNSICGFFTWRLRIVTPIYRKSSVFDVII